MAVGVVRLAHTDDYPRQMQTAAQIGATIVAQSAADVFFTGPQRGRTTRAAFEGWMERLARMAHAAREAGLRLVYHNHDWDHVPLDGKTPIELIAEGFAPGEVDFEIDLGWAAVAGVDPLALEQIAAPRLGHQLRGVCERSLGLFAERFQEADDGVGGGVSVERGGHDDDGGAGRARAPPER